MTNPNSTNQSFSPITIGVFGGGQLGRMLAQAALPLGINCSFLESAANCPSAVLGAVFDPLAEQGLQAFAQSAQRFTFEFENTPLAQANVVANSKPIYPTPNALAVSQHRIKEKDTLSTLGIPVADYRAVNSHADLQQAASALGLPLVLKTATGGYDGKGQFVVKTEQDIDQAWQALSQAGELVAEAFVKFEREVSIIAARAIDGSIVCYPLAENHHHNGILSHSIVPAPNSAHLQAQAEQYISKLLTHFNYVGVLTLELFVTASQLIANEMAPRVHNSGHWSIEGAVTSQFENHMRAVAGLPLGSTALVAPCLMINIIGQHPNINSLLSVQGAHVHLYHKDERDGRKIGHITVLASETVDLAQSKQAIKALLPNPLAL